MRSGAAAIHEARCSVCHGESGKGGNGGLTDRRIKEVIGYLRSKFGA